MLILETKFTEKEGYGFGDNNISHVILLDYTNKIFHYLVNDDYINNFVINDNPLATEEDLKLLEAATTGLTDEFEIFGVKYEAAWSLLPMKEILENIALMSDCDTDARNFIVTTNSVDMGLILANSGITAVGSSYVARPEVVNALRNVIDFATIATLSDMEGADEVYAPEIHTESRLIYVAIHLDSMIKIAERSTPEPVDIADVADHAEAEHGEIDLEVEDEA